MSKHLRSDKTCLNCGDTVEKRYCSNCGQENVESRQSFGHLLGHFIEDLTHYEGRFWLTIRSLFARPGRITAEYLEGKRNRYVVPVRLYIFLSFVTFLLPHILPDTANSSSLTPEEIASESAEVEKLRSERKEGRMLFYVKNGHVHLFIPSMYMSLHELDSAQRSLPEHERMGAFERWRTKKFINLLQYHPLELADRFFASFSKNFPKALLLYLPLFAFFSWLFQDKKRWLYFDNAIFTLHYFSFMLLVFCIYMISGTLFSLFAGDDTTAGFYFLGFIAIFLYFIVYFFIARKKLFQERLWVSLIKSTLVFSINLVLFATLMVSFAYFTILLMH